MVDVAGNYRKVLDRIDKAAARAGRDPRTIRLLAASKSQPVERIRAARSEERRVGKECRL